MANRKTSLALAAIVAGLLASTALAQSAGDGPAKTEAGPAAQTTPEHTMRRSVPMMGMMGQGMVGQGMMGQGMMAQGTMCGGMGGMGMMSARLGHVEGRIAFLKAELKITDAQLPLWNAVADAMSANAKNMAETCTAIMNREQTATLPDSLAARETMLAARLDAVRKLKTAIGPLYAALSDEQKKTADQMMPGIGSGMGMGMRPTGTKTP